MKRAFIGLTLGLGLAACGGDAPFGTITEVDGGTDASEIPGSLAGNLNSFTYNPDTQTLSIDGVAADGDALSGAYRRRASLDRGGYEAYTAQDSANGRHSTVYVREVNGTRAAVVSTGGQFQSRFAGGAYGNTTYSPRVAPGSTDPDSGLVYYTGRYVGLLNAAGSTEDLTPPNPGEDPSVLSAQAAEVTGDVQITADFATSTVDGIVYNRLVLDYATGGTYDPNSATPIEADDLALESASIQSDGTFLGTTELNNSEVGTYGGIFGGTGATEVAGVIEAENHISTAFSNESEYGIFVLSECAPPNSGPNCDLAPAATP